MTMKERQTRLPHGQPQDEPATLEKVVEMLRKLTEENFFGEVGITFQNGRPHTIKVYKTYKANQL